MVRTTLAVTGAVMAAMVLLDRFHPSQPRPARSNPVAVAAIATYSLIAVVSSIWSVEPSLTSWRALVYLGLPFSARAVADLGTRVRPVLAWVTAVAVAGSLLVVRLRPDTGLDHRDFWRGLYTNRNSLAPLAAIGLLVGIRYMLAARARARAFGAGLVGACIVAMAGSGSRTSMLALALAVVLTTLPLGYRWLRDRYGSSSAVLVTSAVGAAGLTVLGAVVILSWNMNTTRQRYTIWELVWGRIIDRPIHGHGFYAFWNVPELIAAHELLQRGSAHNSLLEVGLGLGLLGAVPFVTVVSLAARNAGRDLWCTPSPDTWMWAAVVAFSLLENITESFVLWFSYNWVLVMAAALPPKPRISSTVTRSDQIDRGGATRNEGQQPTRPRARRSAG